MIFLQVVAGPEFFSIGLSRTPPIDQLGLIAGYSPYSGDPIGRAIQALLDYTGDTGLSERPTEEHAPNSVPADNESWNVLVEPGRPDEPHFFDDYRGHYTAKNMSLEFIVSTLWGTPSALTLLPDGVGSQRYTVTAHLPVSDRDLLLRLCRESVEERLDLLIDKELRVTHAYVMSASAQSSSHLQAAQADEPEMTGFGEGSMIGVGQAKRDIAQSFQDLLGIPVVDETGLRGKYDYSATSGLTGPDAALDLARQLGFDLTPAEKPVEMLVARRTH